MCRCLWIYKSGRSCVFFFRLNNKSPIPRGASRIRVGRFVGINGGRDRAASRQIYKFLEGPEATECFVFFPVLAKSSFALGSHTPRLNTSRGFSFSSPFLFFCLFALNAKTRAPGFSRETMYTEKNRTVPSSFRRVSPKRGFGVKLFLVSNASPFNSPVKCAASDR